MSSKNQIVVPSEARKALGLKPGERLLVTLRDDDVIEMRKADADPAACLEGLIATSGDGDGLWPEVRGG
jgi:AbrB family looped-hinge helix DNA binding protein